jgi:ketosteroid isomerase-like protein
MSAAPHIEVVRRVVDAQRSGNPLAALELLHPEVRYDTTLRPDGRVWHGPEGVRRAMSEWTETWENWQLEVERYIDAGDGRVLVLWSERGRAKSSGVPLAQEGVTVCTVRDGLIVAMVVSVDRAGTLRALGLTPD